MKKQMISVLISLAILSGTCYADIGVSQKNSSGDCMVSGSFSTGDMSIALEILQKGVTEEELKEIDYSDQAEIPRKILAAFTLKTDENGEFSRNFKINTSSGVYTYRYRAADGTRGSGSFRYSDAKDIADFVKQVNDTQDADTLDSLIQTSAADISLDMRYYQTLSEDGRRYALSYLLKKNFTGFEQFSEVFHKSVFEALLKYKTSGEVILSALSDYEAFTNIEKAECYDEYKSMDNARKEIMGEIIIRNNAIHSIDTLNKQFNSAVALAYVSDAVWTELEEYIVKYCDILDVSLKKYNGIRNKSEILKSLSGKKYYSISSFADAFERAVNSAGNISSPGGAGTGGRPGSGNIVVVNDDTIMPTEPPSQTLKPAKVFTDTDSVGWANEAIEKLYEAGIVNGKSEHRFYPDDAVTREEFLKLLMEGLRLTEESAECNFEDVPKEQWYYKYVASGVQKGIVNGISERCFGTGGSISREDMAVMTARALACLKIEPEKIAEPIAFTDGISEYAAEAVEILQTAGIINGVGGTSFAPRDSATRAQAAKIIYGVLKCAGSI